MEELTGQTVGNYLVHRQIGEGGMGMVYVAEHQAIQRRVAIKVLHRDFAGRPEMVGRLANEARAMAQIDSEHVVRVLDYGVLPVGIPYLVMEWLEGETLATCLQRQPRMPLERAIGILGGICDAVASAHAQGVIHRDLKPDNVFLTVREGRPDFVKVLDFGIAKFSLRKPGEPFKTQTGVVLGTPAYMSPEQCESRASLDHRSDVYALGVIAFQMTTGRLPFTAEGFGGMLVAHLTSAPPAPRSIDPGIPERIDQAILKALQKKPEDRFVSVGAFLEAISGRPPSTFHVGTGVVRLPPAMALPATAHTSYAAPTAPATPSLAASPTALASPPAVSTTMRASTGQLAISDGTPPPASAKPMRLVAVALGSGLLLAGATWWAARAPRSPGHQGPLTANTIPSEAPPGISMPRSIHVALSAQPREATVWLDGRMVPNPHATNMPADGQPHVVVATAPGFEDQRRTVVFDRPIDLAISLPVQAVTGPAPAQGSHSGPAARVHSASPARGDGVDSPRPSASRGGRVPVGAQDESPGAHRPPEGPAPKATRPAAAASGATAGTSPTSPLPLDPAGESGAKPAAKRPRLDLQTEFPAP